MNEGIDKFRKPTVGRTRTEEAVEEANESFKNLQIGEEQMSTTVDKIVEYRQALKIAKERAPHIDPQSKRGIQLAEEIKWLEETIATMSHEADVREEGLKHLEREYKGHKRRLARLLN